MNDDATLLRSYTEEASEAAFTEIVRRYVDLVYGAAMRRTRGDAHLANDISQQVFTALARTARRLPPDIVLGAWLHTATRNAAIKLMISEHRRRVRENEALALDAAADATVADPTWTEIRPLLDGAIDELSEADRTTLVFRFFERLSFAEIGAALRISEDAARMRTERALEKLRGILARRGIASTAAALATIVSSQPLVSAPTELAAELASHALAAASTGTIVTTIASLMTAKILTTAGASAILAFVIGTYVGLGQSAETPPAPHVDTTPLAQMIASLRSDNEHLHAEVAALNADLSKLKEDNAAFVARHPASQPGAPSTKSPTLGMARYEVERAVLNNLRQVAAARDQFRLDNGRAPESIDKLVGRGAYIKTLRTVGGENYSELSITGDGPLTVSTPDGIAVTFDPAGQLTTKPDVPPEVARLEDLRRRTEPAVNKALAAFRAANNGGSPKNEQALLPYFSSPQEGADFVEFVEVTKAAGGQ